MHSLNVQQARISTRSQPVLLARVSRSVPIFSPGVPSARLPQGSRTSSSSARRTQLGLCHSSSGQSRQFETELFRKLFGTPPPPKQGDANGGGGDKPPGDSPGVEEEDEEPSEEQKQQAKLRARQQALFNCISILLFLGTVSLASTWQPHFLYLGRIWSSMTADSKTQTYAELGSEVVAWVVLLSMGWPWNLLIYPAHLTRKELTNARKESRAPSAANIRKSVYNPFARRPRPPKPHTATAV